MEEEQDIFMHDISNFLLRCSLLMPVGCRSLWVNQMRPSAADGIMEVEDEVICGRRRGSIASS